jgi:MoxR-like ATPase
MRKNGANPWLATHARPEAQLDRFMFKILVDYPTNMLTR